MHQKKSKLYQLPPYDLTFSGENVEQAFLETAKKIYQNIKDGKLNANMTESGVQHKERGGAAALGESSSSDKPNCSC